MPVLTERRLLTLAFNAMLAVALLAALVLGWRFVGGPPAVDSPPAVRVARLPPGGFAWVGAPTDARYLPGGLRVRDAGRIALLLLREPDGLRAFCLPRQDGRASVPVAASPAVGRHSVRGCGAGLPPGDIACRQTAAGFDFAASSLVAGGWALSPVPGCSRAGAGARWRLGATALRH